MRSIGVASPGIDGLSGCIEAPFQSGAVGHRAAPVQQVAAEPGEAPAARLRLPQTETHNVPSGSGECAPAAVAIHLFVAGRGPSSMLRCRVCHPPKVRPRQYMGLADNGGMNQTAADHSPSRPWLLPAVSLLVMPVTLPVRRPQVMPGALGGNELEILAARSRGKICC
jgi:hypothetical protein